MTNAALLPVDPGTRELALGLYAEVESAPIISPHGHVDAALLVEDAAFSNPTELLISSDHYVTRLLFASGASFGDFGLDPAVQTSARNTWRLLARHWHRFAGTASGYWLANELRTLFGVDDELSAENADEVYDRIAHTLHDPGFRPRALFNRFSIEVLATTDDPLADLSPHKILASAADLRGRVVPTFRPDAYTDPEAPDFTERVAALLDAAGRPDTFPGYLRALEDRRAYFIENGAVSADHGVYDPFTIDLDAQEAARLFEAARTRTLKPSESRLFRGHMLFQMARMSTEDGLVMTVHPGVRRSHHEATFNAFGPDTGHDIPIAVEYTENLRPLLNAFGTVPGFHLVLFSIDETVFSREIAPLAGFYPSVYAGAPWWFLDAPDAVLRFRSAVTETAGFYRTSGFIDDTRAFLSIPARHEMSRRLDSAYLARLVAQERVTMRTARRIIRDTVDSIPREVFKL